MAAWATTSTSREHESRVHLHYPPAPTLGLSVVPSLATVCRLEIVSITCESAFKLRSVDHTLCQLVMSARRERND